MGASRTRTPKPHFSQSQVLLCPTNFIEEKDALIEQLNTQLEESKTECLRLEKTIEYDKKQVTLAEGAKVKAEQQIKELIKEIQQLRDDNFEAKKSNHLLKMELKGKCLAIL